MNIGITGNIASGKSSVSNYLKDKGYTIIDADKVGHDILFAKEVKQKLVENFGEDILEDGEVDRKKLGDIVFSNKKNLDLLNSITHPEIKKVIKNMQEEYRENDLVFLDAALLFEAKFENLVEKVIVVSLDKNTQLKRLMKRNNLSEEEALKRINSQMSAKEKEEKGDYIIDNSKSLENTYNQVDEILKNIEK